MGHSFSLGWAHGGRDACQGDSGGPLVAMMPTSTLGKIALESNVHSPHNAYNVHNPHNVHEPEEKDETIEDGDMETDKNEVKEETEGAQPRVFWKELGVGGNRDVWSYTETRN